MLTDAIARSGKTRTQFAEELGIGRPFLSMLESGKKRPSLELAVRIDRMTGGAVPASSWVPAESTPTSNSETLHDPASSDVA